MSNSLHISMLDHFEPVGNGTSHDKLQAPPHSYLLSCRESRYRPRTHQTIARDQAQQQKQHCCLSHPRAADGMYKMVPTVIAPTERHHIPQTYQRQIHLKGQRRYCTSDDMGRVQCNTHALTYQIDVERAIMLAQIAEGAVQ